MRAAGDGSVTGGAGVGSRRRRRPRATLALLGIIGILAGCTGGVPSPSAALSPSADFDPTGILLVGPGEQVQARPPTEALAAAFGQAMSLVEANPADLGYAWIDPSSSELIVSAATARGRALVAAAGIAVPHRVRDVAHSAAELQRIQDDATMLASEGVIDAELIWRTLPDHRDNRALITIRGMSRSLLDALARRFPADALAVQVDPDQPMVGT